MTYVQKLEQWIKDNNVQDLDVFLGEHTPKVPTVTTIEMLAKEIYEVVSGQRETVDVTGEEL
jgi:hypothetical protein